MSRPLIGKVEGELMDSLFASPELLHKKSPEGDSALQAAAHSRDIHNEISQLSKYTRAAGFSRGGNLRILANLDSGIVTAIEQLHAVGCTCGRGLWGRRGHKMWFLEWLEKHGQPYKATKEIKV